MPKKRTIFTPCARCGTIIDRVRRNQRFCSRACFTTDPAIRLYARVRKSPEADGCWEWTGSRDPNGYGRIGLGQVPVLAHRLAWERASGPIPAGLFVLHGCNNPPCVRPDHLFLGTQAENVRHAQATGRAIKGDRVGTAKLTEAEALEIRRRYAEGGVTHTVLAARFGVRPKTIADLLAGRRWKHLQPAPPTGA